jgi:hypothetical protein
MSQRIFSPAFWIMLLALSAGACFPAQAQDGPFSLELQTGTTVGAYEQARSGLTVEPSLSLRLNAGYALAQRWGVYAGLERSAFGCAGGFCSGGDVTFTTYGGALGLQYGNTEASGAWARLGAIYQQLGIDARDYAFTSDAGIGAELEGGYAFSVSPRVRIAPGIRYARYSVDADDGSTSAVVVIATTIGVQYRF